MVTPRYAQAAYTANGASTVAWPAGTVVGDTAWLGVASTTSSTPKRQPTGGDWELAKTTPSTKTWLKILTAADLAQPLAVLGHIPFLITLPGAWRLGVVTERPGATMSDPNGVLIVFGRGKSALTPTAGKLGADVQNPAYSNRYNNVWFAQATTTGYLSVAGTFNGTDSDGFELIPPSAPAAAVLTSPAPGVQINPGATTTFGWLHQSLAGRGQSAHKVRLREVGAATWSYISGGTLTATETAVASSSQTATLNAGQLLAGHTYEWSASTTEDGVNWAEWPASSTIYAVKPPIVTAVAPSSPVGDVTPEVAWAGTAGTGILTAYQLRITPAVATSPDVGTIYDSGTVAGIDNPILVPDQQWVNGQTLRFWVRTWQSGGLASAWTYGSGTVSWTPPSAPTAVVPVDGSPLQVTVAGLVAGLPMRLQTSTDGTTWTDVVATTVTGATMTIDQPLAGYGVPTLWRAARADANGRWSAWTASIAVSTADQSTYMVGDDGTWLRVCLAEDAPGRIEQDVVVHYPLSGPPRIDWSDERGWAGQVTLDLPTRADVDAALTWLRTHRVWTMRWSPERGAGLMQDRHTIRMGWASIFALERLDQNRIQHRRLPISWVEQP